MGVDSLGGAAPGLVDGSPFSESRHIDFFKEASTDDVVLMLAEHDAYQIERNELFPPEPDDENEPFWNKRRILKALDFRTTELLYDWQNRYLYKRISDPDQTIWTFEEPWDKDKVEEEYRRVSDLFGIDPPDVYYMGAKDVKKFYKNKKPDELKKLGGFFLATPGVGGRRGKIVMTSPGPDKVVMPSLLHELSHAAQYDQNPYRFNSKGVRAFSHGEEFATNFLASLKGVITAPAYRDAVLDLAAQNFTWSGNRYQAWRNVTRNILDRGWA